MAGIARKQQWLKAVAAAVVSLALSASSASAQYQQYQGDVNLHQRIAELESVVARLESQSAQSPYRMAAHGNTAWDEGVVGSGCGDCGGCQSCCAPPAVGYDFFTCNQRCGGWVGSAELLFLKPFANSTDLPGSTEQIDGTTASSSNSFDFETSPRFTFGYVGDDGLGIQARYWEFHHSTESTDDFFYDLVLGTLEFRTIDLEVTQQIDFRHSSLTLTGGARYAKARLEDYREGTFIFVPVETFSGSSFEGVGLTGSAAYTRDLSRSGQWQWYTAARGSMLYGHQSNYSDLVLNNVSIDPIREKNDSATIGILEIHTGPQYTRDVMGGTFFARTGFEGQLWLDAHRTFDLHNENIGFAGFASSVGFTR